ncbi:hypothetical protein MUN76_07445 [Leucobacter rhizosphaerae]|uniref:Uncharacterized protein n=1 Tax=Leucobacter rhizosphaerae TaxID=2932245 RepID=A0ABY4G054_9MICO|nr:hypothetical protein [Leucobacter rhizosphaerae]UOQ61779.1 hypothetical protein MUN76_07445 [Leucobacter rhizosphaerae]
MPSRYDAALHLDIPLEMARRHGIPAQISQAELDEIDAHPPAWLAQSRANRTGKRPVWATLACALCDTVERERPKKWWPEFTFLFCDDHEASQLPSPADPAARRTFVYGIGSRFTGVVDSVEQTDDPGRGAQRA